MKLKYVLTALFLLLGMCLLAGCVDGTAPDGTDAPATDGATVTETPTE